MNQEDTIELVKYSREIGADGAGVVTPIFFSARTTANWKNISWPSRTPPQAFPIYLYNIPQLAVNDLKASVIQRVANRCPNVIGVKYSFRRYQPYH